MVKTSDLILLYLYDYIDEQLTGKHSILFSQPCAQENLGLSKSSLSESISSLVKEGLIEERRKYVESTGRYRSFYFLTQKGIIKAKELQEVSGKRRIKVREKDEIKEMSVSDLVKHLKKIARKTVEQGYSYLVKGERPEKVHEVYEPGKIVPIKIEYTNIIKNITSDGFLDIRAILEPKKYVDYSDRKPEINYFFGRREEIREINDFLKSKSKILCVKGIAGIGKTVLMSKLLEDIKMNVFWHRFIEFSTLRNLFMKTSDFLSKMGRRKIEIYLKGERFEICEMLILLENELKGLNALLVFDDFHKAGKEIVDFFSSFKDLETDVKMIMLGRTIPQFYDRRDIVIKKNIREMVLGGLDKESSLKLLRHRKIEKDLDRLYSLTKGHPLLLELITPGTKAEAEKFIKEEIIGKLKDEEKKALEIGSVFRHPFLSRALVNGTSYDIIDVLVDKSLMLRSGEIYDLHDIIREFVYNRLSEYKKTEYHKMAAEYYSTEKGDYALLEAIYHLLRAEKVKGAAEIITEKYDPLISRGFAKELSQLVEQVPKNRVPNSLWAGVLHVKTLTSRSIGKWDEALAQAHKCRILSQQIGNKKLEAESYCQIGEVLLERGEYDKARENIQKALRILESIGAQRGIAKANYWLGKASWFTGELDDAMRYLSDCFDIAKETNDTSMIAKAIMDIGTVHHLRGEYKESLEHYRKSLSIFEKLDDKYEIARAYNNTGATYDAMGEQRKAIEWYEKCINIGRKTGNLRAVGYGLSNAAENYAKLNKLGKAKECTDDALNIFTRLGEKRLVGACHRNYGIIYHKKKKWDKGAECFEKAIKIASEIEHLEGLSQTYFLYGKMFVDKGDKEKAKKQFEKSIEVYEKLRNEEKVEEVKNELEKLRH